MKEGLRAHDGFAQVAGRLPWGMQCKETRDGNVG